MQRAWGEQQSLIRNYRQLEFDYQHIGSRESTHAEKNLAHDRVGWYCYLSGLSICPNFCLLHGAFGITVCDSAMHFASIACVSERQGLIRVWLLLKPVKVGSWPLEVLLMSLIRIVSLC